MPDALKLFTILASNFTKALDFDLLLLSPEYPYEEKNFDNDDVENFNAKVFLRSTFLILTMHWLVESKGMLSLTSKSSSIDLLELFMIESLINELKTNIGSDWELLVKHTISNTLERQGTLMWMMSHFSS
jgi:hypothetical protein